MMPTRYNKCKCGYLLCCVAVRVLHFSAFICEDKYHCSINWKFFNAVAAQDWFNDSHMNQFLLFTKIIVCSIVINGYI